MKESIIKKACIDYLRHLEKLGRPIYAYKTEVINSKTPYGHVNTGRQGCPDITCLFEGRYIGFEIKGYKGRQSAAQEATEKHIKRIGGEYYVIRSLRELKKIMGDI